jgi:hypothetical protein
MEMTDNIVDTSPRRAAIIAGIAYLVMFFAAIFSEFFVRQGIVVAGDAAATANNIMANETLFRAGLGGYLLILVGDLAIAWALYIVLKPVSQSLSLLAAWSRLVYTAVFAVAQANLFIVLRLLNSADYLAASGVEQLQAQVLLYLNAFGDGWAIGYVFFGLHLFFLGYLAFKSSYIPKILGILLMVSCFTYLIDNVAMLLLPNYENLAAISTIFAIPSFLGEFLLVVWIVIKRGKLPDGGRAEA